MTRLALLFVLLSKLALSQLVGPGTGVAGTGEAGTPAGGTVVGVTGVVGSGITSTGSGTANILLNLEPSIVNMINAKGYWNPRLINGVPLPTDCDEAADVGNWTARLDSSAPNSTFFGCSKTGASTYAWTAFGGSGGPAADPNTVLSTGALDTGLPVIGASGKNVSTGTLTGNTTKLVSAGNVTPSTPAHWDGDGNLVSGGINPVILKCATGGSNSTTTPTSLGSVTIPPVIAGNRITVEAIYAHTGGSTNVATVGLTLGGITLYPDTNWTATHLYRHYVYRIVATSSTQQYTYTFNTQASATGGNYQHSPVISSTVNTSAQTSLSLRGYMQTGGAEAIQLLNYCVTVYPVVL